MTALDALWHLLNAMGTPVGVAFLSSAMVRFLWAQATAPVGFLSVWIWSALAATATYTCAWLTIGAEGTMTGYGVMLAATALSIWVRVFLWRP